MSASAYDINLTVSGSQVVNSPGRFFYYLSGSAGGMSERIQVKHRASGLSMPLMPGQAFELPEGANQGDAWEIINKDQQAAIGGVAVVGFGAFKDNRLNGTVSVVDGAASRSRAGQSYMGTRTWVPGAGLFGTAEVWNPAGSGKNLILEEVTLMQDGGTGAGFAFYLGASTTAQYGNTALGVSKKIGGGAGVGVVGRNDEASAGAGLSTIYTYYVDRAVSRPFGMKSPVVVPPGNGLRVGFQGVNPAVLSVGFQWYEEAI